VKFIAGESTTLRSIHPKSRIDYFKNPGPDILTEAIAEEIEDKKAIKYARGKALYALRNLREHGVETSLDVHISMNLKNVDEELFVRNTEKAIKSVLQKNGLKTKNGLYIMEPNVTVGTFSSELVPLNSFDFPSQIFD